MYSICHDTLIYMYNCIFPLQDRLLRSILPQTLTTTMADQIIESRKRGAREKKHSEFRDLRIQAADNVRYTCFNER